MKMSAVLKPRKQTAPGVCFVCGSFGVDSRLHIKHREKGAYFPFLEQHDPPKGAAPPDKNGTVQSCRICFAFLNQQWESFEITKTPAIKRLYWLKRSDNGHFTGAEMRIQGEYAAQVMGLSYQPGYDYTSSQVSPASGAGYSRSYQPSVYDMRDDTQDSNEALDLTVASAPASGVTSVKTEKVDHCDMSLAKLHAAGQGKDSERIVCYLCRTELPVSACRFIYAQKHVDGEAFFPFLKKLPLPKGAMPLTKQGLTRVCSTCRRKLCRQWRGFDATNTPELERVYRLGKDVYDNRGCVSMQPNNTVALEQNKSPVVQGDPVSEACYLCSETYNKDSLKWLYAKAPDHNSKHSMYFPFIMGLKRPAAARPVDEEGRFVACRACYSYLQRQWQTYQNDNVPVQNRNYVLRPLSSSGNSSEMSKAATGDTRNLENGTAVIPQSKEAITPLNIQISSASNLNTPAPMQYPLINSTGLLAIAPHAMPYMFPHPYMMTPNHVASLHAHSVGGSVSVDHTTGARAEKSKREKCKSPEKQVHKPTNTSSRSHDSNAVVKNSQSKTPVKSSSTLRNKDRPTTSERVKNNCYICGHNIKCSSPHILRSYPAKHEVKSKHNKENTIPYFPFIASRDPAEGANKVTDDGTANVCEVCYFALLKQWSNFENSDRPSDNNRWLRKYKTKTFTCDLCRRVDLDRAGVSCQDVKDNQELNRDGNFKKGIQNASRVIVCVMCTRKFALSKLDEPTKQPRNHAIWGSEDNKHADAEVASVMSKVCI